MSKKGIETESEMGPESGYGTVEVLGYNQAYRRVFRTIANVALVLALASPLFGILITSSYSIINGGYWGLTWGWIIPCIILFPQALAVAELASSMPINGAFYWWTAALAPRSASRPLSYVFGWFNMLAGFTSMASFAWATSTALSVVIPMVRPEWAPTKPQMMAMSWGFVLFWAALTLLGTERISFVFLGCTTVILVSFLVFVVALPVSHAKLDRPFVPASVVFGQFTSFSEWSSGVALPSSWFCAAWTVTGWYYPAYVSEEAVDAGRKVPKAILLSYSTMAGLGAIVVVVVAFCLNDLEAAVSDPSGLPLYTLLADHWGTNLTAAFLLVGACLLAIGGSSQLLSLSNQLAAFARDGGLPYPHVFSAVNEATNMPLAAIGLMTFGTCLVLLFGLSSLASTIIYSLAVIALYITYMVPIIARLTAGNRFVPGPFYLGKMSKPVHLWALVVSAYMLVIITFPASPNFTAATFNYNWVVAGGLACLCGLAWICTGRKMYRGPDLDALEARALGAQADAGSIK